MWALILLKSLHNIRGLHNFNPRSKSIEYAGAVMGIHYDYKSTRGEKAMKKEAKRKARIEQKRAKKLKIVPQLKKRTKCMILINL